MNTKTPLEAGCIALASQGAICWITFDNPKRMNALNSAMWEALPGLIKSAEDDDDIRVIVLRGEGQKAFSAGADISEFGTARTGAAAREYDQFNHAAFDAVMTCAKPTIAMVHGFCMGGGMEIALCCDLRLASTQATFSIPATKLGIGYNPRWIRPLLTALSAAQAKEVLFTGRRFSADEAMQMGMLSRLCAPEDLETETEAMAQMIAENAPLAVYAAKRCIEEFVHAPENPDMATLDALIEACFDSADYAEGRKAFEEKRKPVFTGK